MGEVRSAAEIQRLEALVRSMQEDLERLSERQAFTDSLLQDGGRVGISAGRETQPALPS